MANNWILPEQEIEFAMHPDYGLHFAEIYPPVFSLVEGEGYTVRWDGVAYTCQAGPLEFMGMTWQVIGNKALLGGEDTGEPFGIGSTVDSSGALYSNVMATTDTAERHTVGIALGEIREPGILLADHNGERINFGFPERLRVDTTEGETEDYVRSGLLPEVVEKTVELDFSGGDMAVTPEAGQVFSGVNIPTPAGLIPENIAEGVSIAGILGAMAAGGKIKFEEGGFLGTDAAVTVSHNLGCVPDIAVIVVSAILSGAIPTTAIFHAVSSSRKLFSQMSTRFVNATLVQNPTTSMSSDVFSVERNSDYIENSYTDNAVIWKATDKTIQFGNEKWVTSKRYMYKWFLISGLI